MLSPSTRKSHGGVLSELVPAGAVDMAVDLSCSTLRTPRKRRKLLEGVKSRSDALTFVPTPTGSTTNPRRQQMEDLHVSEIPLGEHLADFQKLDAMNGSTDMEELCRTYFDGNSSPLSARIDMARLEEKTFILLNWAMGLFELGVHRGYAVHTLLIKWNSLYEGKQAKSRHVARFDFFNILYNWLDVSEMARNPENAFAIGITFGELTRQGFFLYGRYVKVLIASGQTARARTKHAKPSHHLALLAAMPIFVQAKDLLQQRRLALCGDDPEAAARLDAEDNRTIEAFKEEVREYVPEVFGWSEFRPELS